jgi:hypothetical protein
VVSRTPRLRRLVEDILAETAAETGAALRLHAIAARTGKVAAADPNGGAAAPADGSAAVDVAPAAGPAAGTGLVAT